MSRKGSVKPGAAAILMLLVCVLVSLVTAECTKAQAQDTDMPVLQRQPQPQSVHFYQMTRWHFCESRTVCYSYNGGPLSCVPDIEVPWLEEECSEPQRTE